MRGASRHRGTLVLLCVFSSLLAVQARQISNEAAQHGHRTGSSIHKKQLGRQLASSNFCPQGCSPDGCVEDSTQGGLRCNKCLNNLVVVKASGVCGESQWTQRHSPGTWTST